MAILCHLPSPFAPTGSCLGFRQTPSFLVAVTLCLSNRKEIFGSRGDLCLKPGPSLRVSEAKCRLQFPRVPPSMAPHPSVFSWQDPRPESESKNPSSGLNGQFFLLSADPRPDRFDEATPPRLIARRLSAPSLECRRRGPTHRVDSSALHGHDTIGSQHSDSIRLQWS